MYSLYILQLNIKLQVCIIKADIQEASCISTDMGVFLTFCCILFEGYGYEKSSSVSG